MTSRFIIAGAICAALAACGGDDKDDPASRTFTYGAPQTLDLTTSYSDEAYAAQDGAETVSSTVEWRATPENAATAETGSASLAVLPDQIASQALSGGMYVASAGVRVAVTEAMRRGVAALAPERGFQALDFVDGEPFDSPCVTVGPGFVDYDHCRTTVYDPDTGAVVGAITIDGTFTRTGDVYGWDVTMAIVMSGSDVDTGQTYDINFTDRLYGSMTVTDVSVAGRARSDVSATVRAGGQSVSLGYATIADVELDYVPVEQCGSRVVDGTLEVRRVWTQRPRGYSSADFPDEAVKFTWIACNTVQVAWGQ